MPNKIINIFGCSQTAGVPDYKITTKDGKEFFGTWAYWLSVWNPDITFYNYSWPGTSLTYSCHCFDTFKHKADKNIIQMTGPHRFTYHTPLLDPFDIPLEQITDNYFKFTDNDWRHENIVTVTHLTGTEHNGYNGNDTWHKNWLPFVKEYYNVKPRDHAMLEHVALMEYFGKRADFSFSHAKYFRRHYTELHDTVPSILNELTEEEYESYKVDIPGHFNEQGHKFMATWVAKKLNLAFSE
jgi:hypothetical protein